MNVEQVTQNADELHWFKSSYSGSGGGDCVEVAAGHGTVYVRDSKTVSRGPALRFSRSAWGLFVPLARRT